MNQNRLFKDVPKSRPHSVGDFWSMTDIPTDKIFKIIRILEYQFEVAQYDPEFRNSYNYRWIPNPSQNIQFEMDRLGYRRVELFDSNVEIGNYLSFFKSDVAGEYSIDSKKMDLGSFLHFGIHNKYLISSQHIRDKMKTLVSSIELFSSYEGILRASCWSIDHITFNQERFPPLRTHYLFIDGIMISSSDSGPI